MGMKKIVSFVVLFQILIFFSYLSSGLAEETSCSSNTRAPGEQLYPEPDIMLEFDSSMYEVNPDPVSGGETIISGSVACSMADTIPANIFCIVYLEMFSEVAQNSDIVEIFFHKDDEEKEFYMRIEIESDLRGDTSFDVLLSLRWEYDKTGQGSESPDHYETILHIPPYGYFTITPTSDPDGLEFDIGHWNTFSMDVRNRGNMPATVNIEVVGHPPDMEVELLENDFFLNSYQSKLVSIKLRQRDGEGAAGVLIFRINSDADYKTPDNEFKIPVETRSRPESGMGTLEIVASVSVAIFIGLMVTFHIILRMKKRD